MKSYDELTFTDDFLFCKILQENPEMCRELPELELGDETERIFLCAGGTADDISKPLAAFLDYVAGKISDDPFVQRIEKEVVKARDHEEWRALAIRWMAA